MRNFSQNREVLADGKYGTSFIALFVRLVSGKKKKKNILVKRERGRENFIKVEVKDSLFSIIYSF